MTENVMRGVSAYPHWTSVLITRQEKEQRSDTSLDFSPHSAGTCVAVGQAFQPDSSGSQAGKPDLLSGPFL